MDSIIFYVGFWLLVGSPLWISAIVAALLIPYQVVCRLREKKQVYDFTKRDPHLVITTSISLLSGVVVLLFCITFFGDDVLKKRLNYIEASIFFVVLILWVLLIIGSVATALRQRWGHYLLVTAWLALLVGLPLTAPAFYFLWVLCFRERTLAWFYGKPKEAAGLPPPEV